MTHANYPPQRPGRTLSKLPMDGVWMPRAGVDILTEAAEVIDHREQPVDGRVPGRRAAATSVPDVWAQAEIFRTDLLYAGEDAMMNAYHALAVAEWRGLLALFALKDRYELNLSVHPLSIEEPALGSAGAVGSQPQGDFLAVVEMLLPRDRLFSDQTWRQIGSIFLGDQAVGILTPTTIVTAARRAIGTASEPPIPWLTKDGLVDPLDPNVGLVARDYGILAKFALNLIVALGGQDEDLPDGSADIARRAKTIDGRGLSVQALCTLLRDFKNKAKILAKEGGVSFDEVVDTGRSLGFELPRGQPIYPALNKCFDVGEGPLEPAHHTTLFLRSGVNAGSHGFHGLVLADRRRELAAQLSRPASRTLLWGDLTLERAQGIEVARGKDMQRGSAGAGLEVQVDALEQSRRRAAQAGFLLLDVADLFAPRAFRLKGGKISGHPDSLQRYVLPVSPLLLLVMTPQQLRSSVTVEEDAGDVRFSLSLQLLDENHKETGRVQIRRTYRTNDPDSPLFDLGQPLALSTWPNFANDDWRWYGTYYRNNRRDLVVTGSVSAREVLEAIAGRTDDARARVLASFAEGSLQDLQTGMTAVDDEYVLSEMFHSMRPPEAVLCARLSEPIGSASSPEFGGIVLHADNAFPAVAKVSAGANVGIDFGTSNSSIYARLDGQSAPKAIEFANRHRRLIVDPNAPDEASQYANFLPLAAVGTPFLSVYGDRAGPPASSYPLKDGYIWFRHDLSGSLKETLNPRASLHFNLKWSDHQDDVERSRAFLRQAMLMTAAELSARGISPARIGWRFSYPESGNFRYDRYRNNFRVALEEATAAIRIPQPDEQSRLEEPLTESEAAAFYFQDRALAKFVGPTITVDIGGGTTDIAVWDGLNLRWRHSLDLAGRKLLISYLLRRPKLIEALGISVADERSREAFKGLLEEESYTNARDANHGSSEENRDAGSAYAHLIEVLINDDGFRQVLSSRLKTLEANDAASLSRLALVALCGMVYFVGRQLASEKKLKLFEGTGSIDVCLSGRGSLLYAALFHASEGIAGWLGQVLAAATGAKIDKRVHLTYSQDPKHEAAYGLLVWDPEGERRDGKPKLDLKSQVTRTMMIGEKLVADGKRPLEPETESSTLTAPKSLEVREFVEFKRFLNVMEGLSQPGRMEARPAGVRIDLNNHEGELVNTVNAPLRKWCDEAALNGNFRFREPVFMIALRAIVDMVNDRKVEIHAVGPDQ